VNEGCARRAILEHRDGVIVGRAGEFEAAFGEVSYVLAETSPGCYLQLCSSHYLLGCV
jgi:hypothetical protein